MQSHKEEATPVVEQPRANVVVNFPQSETQPPAEAMTATTEAAAQSSKEMAEQVELLERLASERVALSVDRLTVKYDSITVAEHERGALLRIFRDRWRGMIRYHMSPEGGNLTLEVACTMADAEYGKKPTPAERFQQRAPQRRVWQATL